MKTKKLLADFCKNLFETKNDKNLKYETFKKTCGCFKKCSIFLKRLSTNMKVFWDKDFA
jgi:hypothetical protein